MISAGEGRTNDAITDLQSLMRNDPNNVNLQVQLARYYIVDSRPRKAISLLDRLIEKDKAVPDAYRTRADANLNIGKHAAAVGDYDEALKLDPDSRDILNNLSWVLATSPDDSVRDGKRSVELAIKACELTDYKEPHILSTLGAGYAESGDFRTAIKWSSKAAELGREQEDPQVEQLEAEVESYKAGKPFREIQNVEEKAAPPRRVIET
jgi:Tfp pilus assembly protein PilF